ncbi:hypothetical protein GGD52_003059 [Agrobacterium tumefaciens]|nr:hypothetical protein [Agrobacterium radiobacter]MBB5588455.1 hypothetical protein [Agrobacterium radiobacter]
MSASRNWRRYGLKQLNECKKRGAYPRFLLNGSTPKHHAALSISSAPFVGT